MRAVAGGGGTGSAVTDTVFVARHGLLRRRLTLVPHAKVQSVRFGQGPWERRLGLANVAVDHGANRLDRARLRDADEARSSCTRRRSGPVRGAGRPAGTGG